MMDGSASEGRLARALAERTGTEPQDWFFTFKARYGMREAFSAARETLGDGSAVSQLFTCLTAVTPILGAGLSPVYADESEASWSIDPARLELPADVRALSLQHTFGMVDAASSARLAALAHGAGAVVVEDCAHCVGRMARGAGGAPVADVSVHSFGIEKILPTQFGGAVWVNPDGLSAAFRARLRERLAALPAPDAHTAALARRYRAENRVLAHLPHAVSVRLRLGLARAGAIEPAVSEDERRGLPGRDPLAATDWVLDEAARGLGALDGIEGLRRETVSAFRRLLADMDGVSVPAAAMEGEPQPLLRFPIVLADERRADGAIRACLAAGLYAQPWYRPELGPGVLDAGAFRVPRGRLGFPVHERLTAGCVALPADVGEEGARRAAEAVAGVLSS